MDRASGGLCVLCYVSVSEHDYQCGYSAILQPRSSTARLRRVSSRLTLPLYVQYDYIDQKIFSSKSEQFRNNTAIVNLK